MQARGLKRVDSWKALEDFKSRLMQARGLKQRRRKTIPADGQVAPHAGAWIETFANVFERT